MSFRTGILVAALIFVVTLIVRLPASLLVSHLPPDVSCDDPGGSVWQGSCGRLKSNGITLPAVSWKLHPMALLHGTLSADLTGFDPSNGGRGSVEVGRNGDVSITNLQAVLSFPPGMGFMPRGTSAVLSLDLPSARIHDGHPTALAGTVNLQQLHRVDPPTDLGSYQLQFPAADAANMTGQLRDLEGPLAVNGQVVLQPNGEYEANGTVVVRNSSDDSLNQALQVLGPPDPQGRRSFSLSGSL